MQWPEAILTYAKRMEPDMDILVTGGAGLIGSQLCEVLLQQGNRVIVWDNFHTGSMDNLDPLKDKYPHALEVHRHDVTVWAEAMVDQIYHLACPASPVHYMEDPVRTAKTAFLGTLNMLELATGRDIPILLASTSEVYGDPTEHPQTENYTGNVNQTGVRACYDEGKRIAETLAYDFMRQYVTKIRVARIFNTYGPNQALNDGRVMSEFIVKALKGENLIVNGDGRQTRSFCYVNDLVSGLIKLMGSAFPHPINLGNPDEISMLQLAQEIIEMTPDAGSKIDTAAARSDEPMHRCPDINLARKILDWKPLTSRALGLKSTIMAIDKKMNLGVLE
jgi:UDP-glucuronate decarboxylase